MSLMASLYHKYKIEIILYDRLNSKNLNQPNVYY